MTAFRFFLILVIFCMVSVAWLVLGGTIEYRTADLKESMAKEIDLLWGPSELVQTPPFLTEVGRAAGRADPVRSAIAVHFDHENRYKGLLWFSTYTVRFSGTYTVLAGTSQATWFNLQLPSNAPFFESLRVTLDGKELKTDRSAAGVTVDVPADGANHVVVVEYQTRGRDRWLYGPAADSRDPVHLTDFDLAATTNFSDIDYPKGSVSPSTAAQPTDGGMKAAWQFKDYQTRQRIGIEMPARQNSGPIAARMAFYAPVSLFFFFTVLFAIILLKQIPLHPMHYLFISAGFFAFHILMAYLVDKINIHYAFWICSLVSVFLVTNYMRLVAGVRFALLYVGVAQLVYLVGFSYAFFATGWTGLTIVVVAILTLFVLMMATGRIDWNAVFSKPPARVPSPPAPPATPPGA